MLTTSFSPQFGHLATSADDKARVRKLSEKHLSDKKHLDVPPVTPDIAFIEYLSLTPEQKEQGVKSWGERSGEGIREASEAALPPEKGKAAKKYDVVFLMLNPPDADDYEAKTKKLIGDHITYEKGDELAEMLTRREDYEKRGLESEDYSDIVQYERMRDDNFLVHTTIVRHPRLDKQA